MLHKNRQKGNISPPSLSATLKCLRISLSMTKNKTENTCLWQKTKRLGNSLFLLEKLRFCNAMSLPEKPRCIENKHCFSEFSVSSKKKNFFRNFFLVPIARLQKKTFEFLGKYKVSERQDQSPCAKPNSIHWQHTKAEVLHDAKQKKSFFFFEILAIDTGSKKITLLVPEKRNLKLKVSRCFAEFGKEQVCLKMLKEKSTR